MTIEKLSQTISDCGVTIDYTDVLSNIATALKIDNDFFIALNTRIHSLGTDRQVEILTHELGHCECDCFITIDKNTAFARHLLSQVENRVKAYVVELLLPLDNLENSLRYSDNLWNVADELGVSHELLNKAIDYYEQQGSLQRYFCAADCASY